MLEKENSMFNSIVEAIFYHAGYQPDKLCLADDYTSVTYAEFTRIIARFVTLFAKLGIVEDNRVVVEACQTVEYLAIQAALQLLGAVFVPVEHNCAPEKIQSFAKRTDAEMVIACRDRAYDVPLFYSHEQISSFAENEQPFNECVFPEGSVVSEILFSTGTTGKEKGIVITHANNVALAQNVINGVKMEKDNVEMISSPMNHSHGLRRYYANMYNGSSVILLGSVLNIKRFMENLNRYKVNSIDLVPSALSVVLRLSKNKLADYRHQIRYIQLGAAPMMEADKTCICDLLPETRLYNFYGSTESGCISVYNFNCPDSKKNCIGKPACNATIFIVDDEQNMIASSLENTGFLASSGGMNMLGYWKDEAETTKVLKDGVIYSNDIAYFDEDGDIILLGRKGDVINVGGNKVSPEEIENVVRKIPGVADCGVIPVDDLHKGSVPKLFVQMTGNAEFDPVVIRARLSKSLEPYKVPVYIEQIDLIPRSFNGKLLRKRLQ